MAATRLNAAACAAGFCVLFGGMSAHAAVLLDLDASQLNLTNGANVTSWGPLSQSGTPSPTYSSTGFNGKPSVVFNRAESDYMSSASALNNVGTIAVVLRVDSYNSLDGILGTGNDSLNIRLDSSTKYRSPGNNQDGNDFSGVASGGDLKVNNVSSGSYVVGTSHVTVATSGSLNQNFGSLIMGQGQASGPAANRFFNGAIAEVVFFDKQLTSDEQTGVASILATKWNSTAIPANAAQLTAGQAALAPEPSSIAASASGLLLLALRRRMRS